MSGDMYPESGRPCIRDLSKLEVLEDAVRFAIALLDPDDHQGVRKVRDRLQRAFREFAPTTTAGDSK